MNLKVMLNYTDGRDKSLVDRTAYLTFLIWHHDLR